MKHAFGYQKTFIFFICGTREVDDTLYTYLDNQFCTFITGRHRTIQSGTIHISSHRVENSICFSMNNVGKFRLLERKRIPRFIKPPGIWKLIIRASSRKTIVSDTDNTIMSIDDTRSEFCSGIFASLGGKQGKTHKILIPRNATFFCRHETILLIIYTS